jgi:hypothetical protein
MIVPWITYIQGRNDYTDTDGLKFGVGVHNTSNLSASAYDEAMNATHRTDGVSAHFYVDDVQIIQSIDTMDRTGHAGSQIANENAISVEITGVNSWTRDQWLNNVNWPELCKVLALLCDTYSIALRRASVQEMKNNSRVRAFYGHDDMRQAWGGTDHTDPGPNFPWDHMFAETSKLMFPEDEEMKVPMYQDVIAAGTIKHPIALPLTGGYKYDKAWVSFAADANFDLRVAVRHPSNGWYELQRVSGNALTPLGQAEIAVKPGTELVSITRWVDPPTDGSPVVYPPFLDAVSVLVRYE